MFVFFNILNCRTTRRDSRGSGGRDSRGSGGIVLANALKLVFEDKVFIDGNKTIIFE